jgi:hypothetical protein
MADNIIYCMVLLMVAVFSQYNGTKTVILESEGKKRGFVSEASLWIISRW